MLSDHIKQYTFWAFQTGGCLLLHESKAAFTQQNATTCLLKFPFHLYGKSLKTGLTVYAIHFPLYFQVMSTSGFTSTFSLFFGGALLLIVLNPVASSSTLCETRCENAVPSLKKLKTLWHNVSKRVGGDGKSFYFNLMDVFLFADG